MKKQISLTKYLPDLRLTRLGDEEDVGLCITSLPWPRARKQNLTLGGRPTFVKPIGQWPGEPTDSPRRLLLIADGGNKAARHLALKATKPSRRAKSEAKWTAAMELIERSPTPEYMWERHLLRLGYGGRSLGIAMGLRTGGEVHWWEACRLVVIEETPECLVIEMGGAITRQQMAFEEMQKHPGYTNPLLHKHNWLNGHLYARLHNNGVCEIFR